MTRGKKIFDWIAARHDEGLTVYVWTYTKGTKITPKRRDAIKLGNDGSCYMMRGKNWDSIDFASKITAS